MECSRKKNLREASRKNISEKKASEILLLRDQEGGKNMVSGLQSIHTSPVGHYDVGNFRLRDRKGERQRSDLKYFRYIIKKVKKVDVIQSN